MSQSHSPIEIHVDHRGARLVVTVAGDLDMATAPELAAAADASPPPDQVALDLHEVRFIDSSGLRTLLNLNGNASRLVLVNPSGVVRRLLQLTRTSEAFAIVDDLAELEPSP